MQMKVLILEYQAQQFYIVPVLVGYVFHTSTSMTHVPNQGVAVKGSCSAELTKTLSEALKLSYCAVAIWTSKTTELFQISKSPRESNKRRSIAKPQTSISPKIAWAVEVIGWARKERGRYLPFHSWHETVFGSVLFEHTDIITDYRDNSLSHDSRSADDKNLLLIYNMDKIFRIKILEHWVCCFKTD